MTSNHSARSVAVFVFASLAFACSANQPPPEEKGYSGSHLGTDDGDVTLSGGADDTSTGNTSTGGAGDATTAGQDQVAAAGSGACTCRVTSSFDNGDFYDTKEDCEQETNGKGQGTFEFQGTCDQDGTFVFGFVKDTRLNFCSGRDLEVRCSPLSGG